MEIHEANHPIELGIASRIISLEMENPTIGEILHGNHVPEKSWFLEIRRELNVPGLQSNCQPFSQIVWNDKFTNVPIFKHFVGVLNEGKSEYIVHTLCVCFIGKNVSSSPATSQGHLLLEAYPMAHFWQDTLIFRDEVNLMQNNVGILGVAIRA